MNSYVQTSRNVPFSRLAMLLPDQIPMDRRIIKIVVHRVDFSRHDLTLGGGTMNRKRLVVFSITLLLGMGLALLSGCGGLFRLLTSEPSGNLTFDNRHALSAGPLHVIGLQKNGTVLVAFPSHMNLSLGQFDVSKWTDIVSVAAGGGTWGYNLLTAGLKQDGTVVYTHSLPILSNERYKAVPSWRNITAISVGSSSIVGLQMNGTVVAAGIDETERSEISAWQDIVAVSAGVMHIVGLKKDGTVVAVGNNDNQACDVANWSEVVAISAGNDHTVGLRKDGTVLATGKNDKQQCQVSSWTDILSIAAGSGKTVGLKKDGTVITTEKQADLSAWTDIIAISSSIVTVGLKKDGTVEQFESSLSERSFMELSTWQNIGIPDAR